MKRHTKVIGAIITLCCAGVLATNLTVADAALDVRDVPGVRNANPTPDSPVRVMLRDRDEVVEGTVVISDAHWVAVDKADGTTAWIPTASISVVQGERKPVR